MAVVGQTGDGEVLAVWMANRVLAKGSRRPTDHGCETGNIRFAFYGRTSTDDHQDPISSRRWQLDNATELIAGHGRIVAEFFDIGVSRRLAWPDRPQAAAVLASAAYPEREFDALVVGEYERAFCGNQLTQLAPVLAHHGMPIWLPEFDGPVDFDNPVHEALIMLLGTQSQREVRRARHRVLAAMCAQARDQGRYLGGRPSYGYRLTDAGPHPNTAHARWGRRLHRLEPDPATAPHVKWIFAQRLTGHSVASIARMLNERGIPCPSCIDRDRNPHRSGQAWSLRTVAAILANPRYTGRQVWNRPRPPRGGRSARDAAPPAVDRRRRVDRVHGTGPSSAGQRT
jgi:site-specific DNA recombinase